MVKQYIYTNSRLFVKWERLNESLVIVMKLNLVGCFVESSCADIRTCILLILGCAIQCERKEFFIQQILTKLNSEQQHAIKDCITEVGGRVCRQPSRPIRKKGCINSAFIVSTWFSMFIKISTFVCKCS